jgi:serine/threonine protein kinase
MTEEPKEPLPEHSLGQAIQTRHPGISDEIQGAINTLRKIQRIAVPNSDRLLNEQGTDAQETTDGAARGGPLLAPGDSFGRYQIVRLLGRGAMGAVYLAYDPQLERHVALKTPFLGDDANTVNRFFREARAAAQLRSPYICTVYDVGQIAGIHYISMAFIDGQPLDQVIAEGKLNDLSRIADIIKKIARGLQKAHEQGIMHRDLKPANLMIDTDGEPVVMDFGLARKVNEDSYITTPGAVLGTPAYMSPEQASGDSSKITNATDIYSLGVVLYRILTGRVPFEGSFTDTVLQILSSEPQKPSAIKPTIASNSPLEVICLKMMAKKPNERYPTMAAVVEALDEAFPRERPAAVQSSAWDKFRQATKRLFSFPGRGTNPPKAAPAKGESPPANAATIQITVDSNPGVQPSDDVNISEDQTIL